ncbi:DUF817 domain-containing protein [Paenibacillus sp. CC-CFT747]|nr:DUF817 domain-containing protein [Paenibacillus sp. CC-CFT747]
MQLLHFGYQQAVSCLFAVCVFGTLALSKLLPLPAGHRYDFILVVLLLVQVMMVASGLETKDELKVICVFHLIGLALELYKTHMGSWTYPEASWSKVFGVPLYSGFMYASVASYLCQAWRRFNLSMTGWPARGSAAVLGTLIYLNFFTHHFLPDFRWVLMVLVFVVFWKTWVSFTVRDRTYRMPLSLSFLLIGFFIWVAENIATFFGAWQYPDQEQSWHLVGIQKIGSWYLLVIISIILVAQLKRVKEAREPSRL